MAQHLAGKIIGGFAAACVFLVLGVANPSLVCAQSPQPSQAAPAQDESTSGPALVFEVASIKPDNQAVRMYTFGWYSPGTFSTIGVTVHELIERAYGVQDNQISGAPAWVGSQRYDITAKSDEAVTQELQKGTFDERTPKFRAIIQSLLKDRFSLTLHHETKELPVFALVVAKNGPKFEEAKTDDTYPNGIKDMYGRGHGGVMHMGIGELTLQGFPIWTLVQQLSGQPELVGRVVLDQTGLKDDYDLTLKWTPQVAARSGFQSDGSAPPSDSGTSLFSALQEQLGLRIESTKGPVDTIVIDHIEEPTPN
jgi:uncharacterized protein (TIGR03435 family)